MKLCPVKPEVASSSLVGPAREKYQTPLNKRYRNTGISFNCLHPGYVNTSLGDNNKGFIRRIFSLKRLIALNVIKGASTNVYLASSSDVENVSGKFYEKSKVVNSSSLSYSDSIQEKLWLYSEDIMNEFYRII